MSIPPPRSAPPPSPTPDISSEEADAARTQSQLRMLAEIAEMGMELLRAAHAVARVAHVPANDRAFATIARAVRHTLALQNWLVTARKTRAATHAADLANTRTEFRAQQKRRIRRDAEHLVTTLPDFTRPQRVTLERYLGGIDLDGDMDRPIPEILARICTILAVPPDKIPDLTAFAEPQSIPPGAPAPARARPEPAPGQSPPLCRAPIMPAARPPQPDP